MAPTQVTRAQILDAMRAALAYCRAVKVLRGRLRQPEKSALRWCLLAYDEFVAAWSVATRNGTGARRRAERGDCPGPR
jgi:hypothetical protein